VDVTSIELKTTAVLEKAHPVENIAPGDEALSGAVWLSLRLVGADDVHLYSGCRNGIATIRAWR
jgi:hypothetical protein